MANIFKFGHFVTHIIKSVNLISGQSWTFSGHPRFDLKSYDKGLQGRRLNFAWVGASTGSMSVHGDPGVYFPGQF